MKKFIGMALAAVISASSFTALAAGAIPDHQGTSMDGIEIGTAQLNSAVKVIMIYSSRQATNTV